MACAALLTWCGCQWWQAGGAAQLAASNRAAAAARCRRLAALLLAAACLAPLPAAQDSHKLLGVVPAAAPELRLYSHPQGCVALQQLQAGRCQHDSLLQPSLLSLSAQQTSQGQRLWQPLLWLSGAAVSVRV